MTGMADLVIYCDASFCAETKAAGWAARVILGLRESTFGGPMVTSNSTEAETLAIAYALREAIGPFGLARGSSVEIHSDCIHALAVIAGAVPAEADSEIIPARRRRPSEGLSIIFGLAALYEPA